MHQALGCKVLANRWISSFVGDGAYSEVYKVKRLSDGQVYALKKVGEISENSLILHWYSKIGTLFV